MAVDNPPAPPPSLSSPAIEVAPIEEVPSEVFQIPEKEVQAEEPTRFDVQVGDYTYIVVGNTLLEEGEIREILTSEADLKVALQKLYAAYRSVGYIFVNLRVEINNKTILVQVIEGKIGELDAPGFLHAYIKPIMNKKGVRNKDILYRLNLASQLLERRGEKVKVDFLPATRFAESRMVLVVTKNPDFKPLLGNVSLNNHGGRYSGRVLSQVSISAMPGWGTQFNANWRHAFPEYYDSSYGSDYEAGSISASWSTPWATLTAFYSTADYSQVIQSDVAYAHGISHNWGLSANRLIYVGDRSRVQLSAGFNRVDFTRSVNIPLAGIKQRTDNQQYNYANLGVSFSQGYTVKGKNGMVSGGLTLQKGLSPRFDEYIAPAAADTRYFLALGSLNVAQTLPYDAIVQLNLSGQWADSVLPVSQQWYIGGFMDGTAFLPSAIVADSGAMSRLSLTSKAYGWKGFKANVGIFGEAGAAYAFYTAPGNKSTQSLLDAGLTMNISTPWKQNLNLTYAHPLDTAGINEPDKYAGLLVSISQSF